MPAFFVVTSHLKGNPTLLPSGTKGRWPKGKAIGLGVGLKILPL